MHRSIQILSVVLLLTLTSVVAAQTPVMCGIVEIEGLSQVAPGTPLVLRAKITGNIHTTKPEFKWKVSAGTITAGEGTGEISIDTVGLGGQELSATVELSGAPLGCNGSASKKTHVEPAPLACGRPFDEYGDVDSEDEEARLDNFAIQLSNELLASGYILMSAGQKTYENETTERLDRARSYLVNVREIDSHRVVTVDCGFARELSIKLYLALPGATAPECSNDLERPFFEIKFTKRRPKPNPPHPE